MGRRRSVNHGLPPRMQPKGNAYYYVSSIKPRKWLPLGSDLARAKLKWAELEGSPPQGVSVGELVQMYINHETRADGTAIQYKSYQKVLSADFPIPVVQLRSQHVAIWRELQHARKTFANGCIAVLVASCRFGHELGLSERITVGKWDVGDRDRDLLPEEFRRIREAAIEWLQVAMDISYLTGARPTDIRLLRWPQVTAEAVLMRQEKTKQRMKFKMNADLASVLDRARARPVVGLYVVATAKGKPVSRNMLFTAWHEACNKAGVTNAQFRDIRAMAAKAAERDGQDFQKLLGHTTLQMSERYLKGRRTILAEPVRKKL